MIVTSDALDRLPRGIVLAGGAFDPLHPGHIFYFKEIARYGPVCCAVATDAYIRERKGRPPLLPQSARMAVVDALQAITYVVAQGEDGEAGILMRLRPALYAKGSDWQQDLPEPVLAACERSKTACVFVSRSMPDSSSGYLAAYHSAFGPGEPSHHPGAPAGTAQAM